jgi:2-aminoadipate transaminase
MGTDIHPRRRKEILAWAKQQPLLLVADEVSQDLRFEGPVQSSFIHDASKDRSLVIGSLSKSCLPGLRVGWIVTSRKRIQELALLKQSIDICTPPLMQQIANDLLVNGLYDEHIKRVRRYYRSIRDLILKALNQHMPAGVTWTQPPGGLNMWVQLPENISSISLFILAVKRKVSFIPGPFTDINQGFINCLQLSYGAIKADEVETGIKGLARSVKDLIKQPFSSTVHSEGMVFL